MSKSECLNGIILDAHTHMKESEFIKYMDKESLSYGAVVNCSSLEELKRYGQEKVKGKNTGVYFFCSFGIHPWETQNLFDRKDKKEIKRYIEKLKPYYNKADAIGEIGMDSVWCKCDLGLQTEAFVAQLEMAQSLGKPVVLHTKGQEKEIAKIIKNYNIKKMVHWYSCNDYLIDYIEQDCYFSVGPDYNFNTAVKNVIENVRLERLLVETDGVEAVGWATGKKIQLFQINEVLMKTVRAIAKYKSIDVKDAKKALNSNLINFLARN